MDTIPLRIASAITLIACSAVLAGSASAQETPEYSRFSGTVSLMNTQAVGELTTGPGFGLAASGSWAVDPSRIFRLRGDFRFSIYDWETNEICLTSCLIRADLNTNHGFMYAGVGPEVVVPIGGPELALTGGAGFLGFSTSSSLSGVDDEGENLFNTTNHDDGVFAWTVGGDLRIPVGSQVSISVGAHYLRSAGDVTYLRKNSITELPDGTLELDTTTTAAELYGLTLGVAFRPFVDQSAQSRD